MAFVWFIVAIPLSVELIAAALAWVDIARHPGLWPRALERLVVPTAATGAVLWMATPAHWGVVAFAFLFVLAWQVVVFLLQRAFAGHPKYFAGRIDTDEDV